MDKLDPQLGVIPGLDAEGSQVFRDLMTQIVAHGWGQVTLVVASGRVANVLPARSHRLCSGWRGRSIMADELQIILKRFVRAVMPGWDNETRQDWTVDEVEFLFRDSIEADRVRIKELLYDSIIIRQNYIMLEMTTRPQNRLPCPECGRRMVFVVVVLQGSGEMFKTWQCDCAYREADQDVGPDGIVAAIVRAREEDDGSVTYNWGTVVE